MIIKDLIIALLEFNLDDPFDVVDSEGRWIGVDRVDNNGGTPDLVLLPHTELRGHEVKGP